MSTEASQKRAPQFGAFLGVFTPTVLTILGVIMYLRLGWVVGNAGLAGALLIIAVSNLITGLTTLSMSALATNMKVGVGGAYFLISRSVGLEVGGAIGIPLFLSQVLSVTLYAFGLAESLGMLARAVGLQWGAGAIQISAAIIVLLVASVAAKSTELTLKLQLPIMGLIGLSIVSLLLGVEWNGIQVPIIGSFSEASPMLTFAVFFPAVTGILTGLSLSGDLQNPSEDIPRGGLAAVALGAVVYLGLPFVLANGSSLDPLITDQLVWTQISAVPALVMLGMWGAILSSAFGAILSAPRTLQALASDRLAPQRFSETDDNGEPLLGLYLTCAMALAAVGLGSLDTVATVVTMFFLTTYGALNAVAALEALVGDPSYRPTMPIPWWAAAAGACGCFFAMFAINPGASLAALAIEMAIFGVLSQRALQAAWGDARGGALLSLSRALLMRLRDTRIDPRNWRPHLIVVTEELSHDLPTVELAAEIGQHRGIVTVSQLVTGDEAMHAHAEDITARNAAMLREEGCWDAFSEVVIVGDYESGAVTVVQANGIAGLQSNTVILGHHPALGQGPERLARHLTLARRMSRLHRCTLIHIPGEARENTRRRRRIQIWWRGKANNGDLMLLIAHLLQAAPRWHGAHIELISMVEDASERTAVEAEFTRMMPLIRMDVGLRVLLRQDDTSVGERIRAEGSDADLLLIGLGLPAPGDELEQAVQICEIVQMLPDVILVRNAGEFSGKLV